MTIIEKTTAFKTYKPNANTPMEKTTRAVKEIVDGETEQRKIKTARLRAARLEREASILAKATAKTSMGTPKKPPIKNARYSSGK